MSASLRILIVAAIVAALAAAFARPEVEPVLVAAQADPNAAVPAAASRALPAASGQARVQILARSPFASDRSAFERNRPAPAPERVIDVRLVAVFAAGGEPRATLLIDGRETNVAVGDQTSLGPVTSISADAVTLGDPPARTVSLFD
ncbi:MAG: hypothetical protein PVI23_15055 [Maricaulaceae bacterium]|jgi:hypothetical protein